MIVRVGFSLSVGVDGADSEDIMIKGGHIETLRAEAVHQVEKDVYEHNQALEALQGALQQSSLASQSEEISEAYRSLQKFFTQWKQVKALLT